MRILFICKKNECYGFNTYTRRSSGLYNSTRFIVEGLSARGIHAKIIEVVDNNCIDKEVNEFKPNVVIIEALWVVPEKFIELKRLHRHVDWFIHLHSHMPFLALEGIAMRWIREYKNLGIGIIANSIPSYDALKVICRDKLIYLPNVYISHPMKQKPSQNFLNIDVGCFGAVRPLKNHLLQALASLRFAKETGSYLRFHINASRTETNGEPVLKNLVQLFEDSFHGELVQHQWHEPEDFLKTLNEKIDIGLQVSLTETFNVVSADYVTAGIPIVVSKEVAWASCFSKAKDDDINDIVFKMHRAMKHRCIIKRNQKLLVRHSLNSQQMWYDFCKIWKK